MTNLIEPSDPLLEALDFSDLKVGEQAQLNALSDAATTWIEKYCNRVFRKTVYTDEAHNGNNELWIYVNNPPIISLGTVTIQESNFGGDSVSTDFASDKFDTKLSTGKIRFKPNSFLSSTTGLFSEGFQNVLIDYTGGFTPVPETIKLIASKFIIEMFDPSEDVQGIEKEKLGNYFYSRGTNHQVQATFRTTRILEGYRIRRVNRA